MSINAHIQLKPLKFKNMKTLFYILTCFICQIAIAQQYCEQSVLFPPNNYVTTLCLDNVQINCPTNDFNITGAFTSNEVNVNIEEITLFIGQNGTTLPDANGITGTINQDNTFNFNVPINMFGSNPTGIYTININSAWTEQGNAYPLFFAMSNLNSGANINFNNCQNPCTNLSINIDSTLDCNTFCGTFTTSAANTYNLNFNVSTTNVFPPSTSSIPITDINNVTVTNGILSGDFCITIDESDFNPNNNYQMHARIGIDGQRCFETTNVIPITPEECEDDIDPCFLNTYIDGNKFCWEGESDLYYVEVISDGTCDNGIKPEEESTIFTFTTNENCIDLFEMLDKVDNKCFRIRVKADIDCPWKECLIGTVPYQSNLDSYFSYFGDCFTTYQRASTNIDSEQVKISPNPAINEILISSENSKIASINIYSVYGKQVKVVEEINALDTKVNLSHLPKGYYMVKVTFENNTSQHKNIILK
tara:strand:- start:7084 stop:8514 length:1431 start_codon:yes stop_codon:yes gene_type:complete